MQQSAVDLVRGLGRIIFLRGSPERVHYSRRRFVAGLFLALLASAAAQFLFHGDHLVFVILRVFAEVTMFMLMVVILTARIPRFRLAYVMLILVLISLAMDLGLLLAAAVLSLGTPAPGWLVTSIWLTLGLIAAYAGTNVLAWGLRRQVGYAALVLGGYWLAVTFIEQAFRWLYGLAAAG